MSGAARYVAVTAWVAVFWSNQAAADFTSEPVTTARVGQPYRYDVKATGTGTIVITAQGVLPNWLSLEPSGSGTATLSGTPASGDVGDGIVLRAEYLICEELTGVRCYSYQRFDITIIENSAPRVDGGIEDRTATEGEPFSFDVSQFFTDPDDDPLTFTASGLPPSFSLSGDMLSGTPTSADASASPFDVTITADDGNGGRVSDTFTLTVTALDRAEISLQSIETTPSPALRGDSVAWTFTVANAGPSATPAVDLTIEFAGNPITFDENACTLIVADDRQQIDCVVGPIENGATESVTITGSAAQAGDAYVTAEVSTPGMPLDPNTSNNSGAATLNVGRAISAEPAQAIAGPAALGIAAGDVDGDGFDDALVATQSNEEPATLHLNVDQPAVLHPSLADARDVRRGLSSVPLSLDGVASNSSAAFGDLDGDGDLDVVIANLSGKANAVYLNGGDGTMTAAVTLGEVDVDSRGVALADLDGDGQLDVAFANAGAETIYLNQGGTYAEVRLPGGTAPSTRGVAAADVVGDSLPDLIFANDDGPAMLRENLGGGTFAAPVAIDPGPTNAVATGDFNGDGHVDLVFGRSEPGASGLPGNPVYTNNGSGGFVSVATLGASPTVAVLTGDVDGDGALDVIAINATGAHQVFLGDGNASFALHPTLLVSQGAGGAALGHVGLGGAPDLLLAHPEGVDVFFNDTQGTFGLGDTTRPVIALNGSPEVTLTVEGSYADAGATASDDVDGSLTPAVDNPVDTKVIGTYTVTYTAVDSAGNAAVPVTRTVRIEARNASGGGGGGAAGFGLLALAGLASTLRRRKARAGRALR